MNFVSHWKKRSLYFSLVLATTCVVSSRQAQALSPQPKPIAELPIHGTAKLLEFSPVGTLLGCLTELPASGHGKFGPRYSWQLQVWDVRTRKLKWSVVRPEIISFDFSPDGTRIAFLETKDDWTHWGQKIQVCRAPSGTQLRTITLPNGTWGDSYQQRVQFAPDNRTLAMNLKGTRKTGYKFPDGTEPAEDLPWQGVWFDTVTGQQLRSFSLPEEIELDAIVPIKNLFEFEPNAYRESNDIFFSPDGKTILADLVVRRRPNKTKPYSGDKSIHQLWLCDSSGNFQRQLTDGIILTQQFSFSGQLFMCTKDTHHLQIFDVQEGQLRRVLALPTRYSIPFQDRQGDYFPSDSLISHDGRLAFATISKNDDDRNSRVGEWDMASGQLLRVFGNWRGASVSSSLALSGDDTILAHLTNPKNIRDDEYIQLWRLK